MRINIRKIYLAAGILLSVFLTSCSCEDCGEKPSVKEPYFINNSGVPITIHVSINYDDGVTENYSKMLEEGDTLHRYFGYELPDSLDFFVPSETGACGLLLNKCDGNSLTIRIQFFSTEEKCLTYSGPVQVDSNDVRYWDAYTIGSEIEDYDEFIQGISYEVVIDDKFLTKAIDCMN